MSCAYPDTVSVKKNRFEIKLTTVFLIFTIIAFFGVVYEQAQSMIRLFENQVWSMFVTHILFLIM
ncbi:MAG: hypothetical protein LWW75_03495, partial [Chlorobiales bacterium]|nr:hypothetical protein [Chlorobiales bacterium]